MVEVNDIVSRLKLLREKGQQIVSPIFTIMHNPYLDAFLLDVPDDTKHITLRSEELEDVYFWDCSGIYPIRSKFNGDYNNVWKELRPYAEGATIDLLPNGYIEDGKEYVWLEHYEKGQIAIEKNKLQIME